MNKYTLSYRFLNGNVHGCVFAKNRHVSLIWSDYIIHQDLKAILLSTHRICLSQTKAFLLFSVKKRQSTCSQSNRGNTLVLSQTEAILCQTDAILLSSVKQRQSSCSQSNRVNPTVHPQDLFESNRGYPVVLSQTEAILLSSVKQGQSCYSVKQRQSSSPPTGFA